MICEECEGRGTLVSYEIRPECCMKYADEGFCCGNPVPSREAIQLQCERCEGTGKI